MSELKTWHLETSVVASILLVVALVSGGDWLELLGVAAVVMTFGHASISNRLVEREAIREVVTVECHRSLNRYWVGKEILWAVLFAAHGAWSALAGVALFLIYPFWRKWYRQKFPMARSHSTDRY